MTSKIRESAQSTGKPTSILGRSPISLFLIWIFLASCSSVKNRYDRENFLTFDSATCETISVAHVSEDGSLDKKSGNFEREKFELRDLRSQDAAETYCGPFCEPPGIRISYEVGERSSSREIFLVHRSGRRVMQINFENKTYRLIQFEGSGYYVERGKCDFTMSR